MRETFSDNFKRFFLIKFTEELIKHSEEVEFAKLLEISRQNLCDIEHNRRFISPKMAAEFARKLGYSSRHFVRICLQDLLNRDGIALLVDVQTAA